LKLLEDDPVANNVFNIVGHHGKSIAYEEPPKAWISQRRE
jgi:hypothetical protein